MKTITQCTSSSKIKLVPLVQLANWYCGNINLQCLLALLDLSGLMDPLVAHDPQKSMEQYQLL